MQSRTIPLLAAAHRVSPTAEQVTRIRRSKRRHVWQRIRLPLAFVGLLAFLLLLGFGTTIWRDQTPPAVAALDAGKPVPSATPTTTPTATSTPTATPLPTATTDVDETIQSEALPPSPTSTPETASEPANETAVETASGLEDPPPVLTRERDGMPMRLIPSGTFTMGASDDDFMAAVDERPQHQVTLSGFYMDQFEVSVAQYAAFLNELRGYARACDGFDCSLPRTRVGFTSRLLEEDLGEGRIQFVAETGYSKHPINHVSWYGAKAYCEYMDGRLPTEAEWEYAARGADGRLYPWGNSPPDNTRAVFNSENYNELLPVDAQPNGASPFGIYGMAGSMWEWTADWYDEDTYARGTTRNPTGPEIGLTRVIRGGAWPFNNEADRLRVSNRHSVDPEFISATIGFRCVADLAER